jgi:hypothetical protein
VIVVGDHWQTGRWRSQPREIVIVSIVREEVEFRFVDTDQVSTCGESAFRRTYIPVPP